MNLKIVIFAVCCFILGQENTVYGQNAECIYAEFPQEDNKFYTCRIITENSNPIGIEGSHETGKTDDDIQSLEIFNQNLKTFSPIYCRKFKNIKSFSTFSSTDNYDEDSLENCSELKHLKISFTKTKSLPERLLHNNPKILTIEMHWNEKLTEIPEQFFWRQVDLVFLSLGNNGLEFLPRKVFSQNKKLEILNLEHNNLNTLNSMLFKNLNNLKKLNLNFNGIDELPADIFKHLSNLEELALWANPITVLHSDSFGSHPHLKKININSNNIKAIDEKIIDNSAVEDLDSSGNSCISAKFSRRDEIKPGLAKCFQNYRPRA